MLDQSVVYSMPGKKVVITAGASGIGWEITQHFMRAGAEISICDINQQALDKAKSIYPSLSTSLTDISDSQQVRAFFDDIESRWGSLDVLVNNAGITGPTEAVENISEEEWHQVVDVNLNGCFYCLHHGVPLLKKSASASIINIASVAGRMGYAYRLPYAATKWAVIGMTESLAKEIGPSGITVNAILPGIVKGERMEEVIRDRAWSLDKSYAEMEQKYLQNTSLRKMVTATDVAHMVLFLCSPAGINISGQSMSVCGNVETL